MFTAIFLQLLWNTSWNRGRDTIDPFNSCLYPLQGPLVCNIAARVVYWNAHSLDHSYVEFCREWYLIWFPEKEKQWCTSPRWGFQEIFTWRNLLITALSTDQSIMLMGACSECDLVKMMIMFIVLPVKIVRKIFFYIDCRCTNTE